MKFQKEKEGANRDYVKIEEDSKKEYASKGVAGTALGLGIAGTALWLLGGNVLLVLGYGSRALFVLYNVDSSEIKRVNRMSLAAPLQG